MSKYISTRPISAVAAKSIRSILYVKYSSFVRKNLRVLDLFSGVGKMPLSILDKENVQYIMSIDSSFKNCIRQKKYYSGLSIKYKVMCQDVLKLSLKNNLFDIIFVDPPYKYQLTSKSLECIRKNHWTHSKTIIICTCNIYYYQNVVIPFGFIVLYKYMRGISCYMIIGIL